MSADYAHIGGQGPGASFEGAFSFAPAAPASATAPANYVFTPVSLGERPGMFTPAARAYFATRVNAGAFNNPAPIDTQFIDNTTWGTHAEANLVTGIGTFTLVPAYRAGTVNNRFSGPAFRAGWSVENGHQASVEARLDGKRLGPIEWLIGGIYFDETISANAAFNQYTVENIQNLSVSNKSWAGFGRLTFHLSDAFRLTGGLRYTKDDKSLTANTIAVVNQCTRPIVPPNFAPCAGGPSLPSALSLADLQQAIPASDLPAGFPAAPFTAAPYGTFGNVILYVPAAYNSNFNKGEATFRLAAEADLFENSLGYASYETGYRSGGFNLTFGKETYAPETIQAFTVGLKNRLLDNRVLLNIEGFYWRYRNQQLAHLGLDARGASSFFTENIGRSTIWGIDVDGALKVGSGTVLTGAVQYLNTKTDNFIYTEPDSGNSGIPPATTCPSVDSGAFFTVNCSGKPLLNSPKLSINAGLEQTFELGSGHKLIFNLNGRYRSNRIIGFDNLPQQNSGDTFEADASLQLAQIDDRWAVTAWIRNLTDERIPTLSQYNSISGGVLNTVYQPPRTYGVKGSFKF
ncbi:TonB-dependent receptor [Sphingobium sp. B8D3B]|uniref:TonB-dependent receptor domain-containing protein n=1 Tax=Sphingobium sp. B8D3B TaxID=2940585 RepID=UPI002224B14A|nr:TonB-dependent receptor [Sphingobium sp. B8D3B]MCW2394028.1 iron complex outermembrane receptor protein [Sphingobium sp. B8D3B]